MRTSMWTACFLSYLSYKASRIAQNKVYQSYEYYLADWYNDFNND